MNKLTMLILCVFAAFLAGCASAKPAQFYTLSPSAATSAAARVDSSVSVGPVSVPAVVDRPQIVLQTGSNQVYLAEFDRWASPLKSDIARVVAENLSSILGTRQVRIFPQFTSADTSYRAVIDILRFESALGKAATLDAFWIVSSRKNGQSRNGRTTVSEPARTSDYAELVAAHSRALGRLSGEIAAVIREMEGQKE